MESGLSMIDSTPVPGHADVMSECETTEVADGVFFVSSGPVNWTLLVDGDAVTVVDTGFPAQLADVEASVRAVGRDPRAIEAVLITHAHVDHLGCAQQLSQNHGAPVFVHPEELAHVRGQVRESVTPARVLANVWRPGALRWISSIRRLGVASPARVDQPQPFPTPGALDCPGRPVPVPTPGHTSGHSAFHLPQHGVVITGDALVTGHAISRRTGPQSLPKLFHHDRAAATRSLHTLAALDADTALPGHGAAHHGPVADAVAPLLG